MLWWARRCICRSHFQSCIPTRNPSTFPDPKHVQWSFRNQVLECIISWRYKHSSWQDRNRKNWYLHVRNHHNTMMGSTESTEEQILGWYSHWSSLLIVLLQFGHCLHPQCIVSTNYSMCCVEFILWSSSALLCAVASCYRLHRRFRSHPETDNFELHIHLRIGPFISKNTSAQWARALGCQTNLIDLQCSWEMEKRDNEIPRRDKRNMISRDIRFP